MQKVYSAERIFTGEEWIEGQAVVAEEGFIQRLIPQAKAQATHFDGCLLVPAFVDLQVYGASGKLFSLFPEPQTLALMQETFLQQGTIAFLPTVATNTIDVFLRAIDAVRLYWEQGGQGVAGLHLEGPWLNVEKRGAHTGEWIHTPSLEEVKQVLEAGRGVVKVITIAPEICSAEVLDYLAQKNILLSAGHSKATYDQAMSAFDKGVSLVTHLFNAMSPLHHREPGLVGAAFRHRHVCASIIPDGYHVDFAAVAIAREVMQERLFAITDAVTDTTEGPYRHQRAGDKYECNGVLSGSSLTMHQAFLNLVKKVNVPVEEALRMCSLYPARAAKLDRYGKIAPGFTAQMLVLNRDLEVAGLIVP